ncbi:ParA family protein [Candidatus Dependentiae bacterium]|nr:ParA family protein [Candidatus Dependentiae bacterium]
MDSKYLLTLTELSVLSGCKSTILKKRINAEHLFHTGIGRYKISPEAVRVFLQNKNDFSFKIISHINLRGGVGKTTCAVSLATRAKQYGFKTAILDMDSQASATLLFNMTPEDDEPIFSDIWQNPELDVIPALKKIEDNLYILPSSLDNGLLDLNLINPASQKNAVSGVCNELKNNNFELISIDCPPSLGAAVISAICASNIIVIPVCSDVFSIKGIEITLKEIKSICGVFNLPIPVIKILFMKFDAREAISLKTWEFLKNKYSDMLIPNYIRTSSVFSKTISMHETIFLNQSSSKAGLDFDQYIRNLLNIKFTETADAQF